MLEAIRERAQGWIAKVILALLIVPFALWGVDSYFSGGGKEKPAATVNGEDISQQEFLKAVRDQSEAMGGKVDEKALRANVIEQLVNTRLLTHAALKEGFTVLEPQIQAMLAGLEAFQENGKFSQARLDTFLRNRGMSEGELRALLQQDQLLRQLQVGLGEGALVSRPTAARLAGILSQQREVNEITFDQSLYAKQAKITDQAVQAEYERNKAVYVTPRQARVQYVVLSLSKLEQDIQVSDEQARQYYEANPAQYQEPEQRRASHILVKAPADAKARQAAKAKAEQLLAELRKAPARFAEIARQSSDDPGSAQRAGDLGAFSRDMMVKPFADAVWSMKPGEIRGLVESEFGLHIIRLDGVIPGAKVGFEVVKGDIQQQLRGEAAKRRFAEVAERFSNMVYEQPDSLEPVAKDFGLTLETSGWVDEKQATPTFLANPRVAEALFAEDSLTKHHNIEAIEVAPSTLVSARVIEYRPAGTRPLTEVASAIRQKLEATEARKLAVAAGQKALAATRGGQEQAGWSAAMTLSRMQALNLPAASVKAIFRADVRKLPAYVGVESEEGYRLYRLNRVVANPVIPDMAAKIQADLRRLVAQEEMRAYLEHGRAQAKVEVNQDVVEQKAE